jgi:hypothetical protein
MRPQALVNVVDGYGSATIVGRAEAGVDDTVADPTGRRGHAPRGVAELARLASSTTLNFASRGSLAQSRPTIDPSIISDEDMAWLLVDAVDSRLTGYERTIIFVELGGGESYLVIERILTALMSTRMALPVAILSKLTGWLNSYAGSPEEPRLRMMLAVIRLQWFEAV